MEDQEDALSSEGANEVVSEAALYAHVVRLVSETAWAVLPETLAVIADVLSLRASGGLMSKAEIRARIAASARQPVRVGAARSGSVAVIPVQGVITRRAGMFTETSGMVSLEGFMAKVRAAHADDGVGAVVMAFDSPGGDAAGVHEAAAELRSMRGTKPLVAVADGMAASGAYWLASQADELVVTPSGSAGSIGVYTIHRDMSAAMERQGVKATVIRAGKYKAEGNPFQPLGNDAQAAIQERIDATYDMFVRDVAAGRGVTAASVRNGYGEGRVVTAARAKELGMVDRVATLAETITRLQGRRAAPPPSTGNRASAPGGLEARLASLRLAALA